MPRILPQKYWSTSTEAQEYSHRSTAMVLKGIRLRYWKESLTFLTIVLLSVFHCQAQGFSYHPLPNQKQLPVANMNVIIQDHEGYMWYGTAGGGLCRDDGYEVVTYSSKNVGKGVMESDEITCIAEDHKGKIWFGTRAGLYYINKVDGNLHRVVNEHVGVKKVNCIGVTFDGCVWVGIQQSVLKFSKEGTYVKTLSIGDNSREETKEMMVDSKGMLWITILRGGLVTINPKNDRLTHQPWDYPSAASYILEDTLHHCYWVGTWGGGIVHYPSMEVEHSTLIMTENQKFSSEIYNMWIDPQNRIMWVSTMDDLYAYKLDTHNRTTCHLRPLDIRHILPAGKKLINKLITDRKGNLWVPGFSPHTFILSQAPSGSKIHREEVKAMTERMGYKIMVSRIACEGQFFWIYQNRTRLSLYDASTGQLAFMATEAFPTPLSTQKPLSRCQNAAGVWTCNGKKLIHAWHEGMTIHWEEVPEAQTPNYISVLSDEGNGKLLIGTEKQVFVYNYRKKTLRQLTDSVGIVQQVGYDRQGKLTYTTDPQAPKSITDRHGHVWTLNELTLQEYSPKTGASRTLHATDSNINMDSFNDITLSGDSICLGGIGAYCLIGSCKELDTPHPNAPIIVTRYDTLKSIKISTMNHLHAHNIQFAYRIDKADSWTEMPVGENTIDISSTNYGYHTLSIKATDEYGQWHEEQVVYKFSIPLPWYLRWYAWCIYVALAILLCRFVWQWQKHKRLSQLHLKEESRNGKNEWGVTTSNSSVSPQTLSPTETFLAQVKYLVNQNLSNTDYSINELCRDLGMSRMNLYRKFQSITDTTPSEFIRTHRLAQAAELLRNTSKSISEIAYYVGFSSPQYFAKCFKEEYGVTPSQWKEPQFNRDSTEPKLD
ncbi:MAG: helix-turn-helix domain-containing protein [Bacteroidaceae bacterium]|nr:helix-turn-helix domain-containing protein [Bacteroidaceae bacterium]